MKDNKDVNYDNNNILYSKPTNPEINITNPFIDTEKLIPEKHNLNMENNILQPISSIETGNLNIPDIASTNINNNFSTQNINTDFPLISNPTPDNNLQTSFAFGSGTNYEEYSTNFKIGN